MTDRQPPADQPTHMFWCCSHFACDSVTGVAICNCGVARAAQQETDSVQSE